MLVKVAGGGVNDETSSPPLQKDSGKASRFK